MPVYDEDAPSIRHQIKDSPAQLRHSELFYSIHELSRLISTYFDQAMVRNDLTHAQWWGLMHIVENEGLTQSELADIMQMGKAATGKLIDRLAEKNWAERRADPKDSRIRRIYLLPNALPVFAAMREGGAQLFADFLEGMSEDEERALVSGLRQIKVNAVRRTGAHAAVEPKRNARRPSSPASQAGKEKGP